MGNDSSRNLTPTEVSDLKKQTTFSQHEIKEWYQKFHTDCPSGEMNKDDFKSLYEQLFPGGDSSSFAEHVFHVYDKDGNGFIDFKEFICTISIASRGSIDEKLRWAFGMYDLDGNGYVTKKEVLDIFQAIAKMRGDGSLDPAKAVENLFEQLDKNGDDKLSDMEFILGAKSSPEVLYVLESDKTVE